MTPLGLRIARRHARTGALLRPRSPLVLRRLRPPAAGRPRAGLRGPVSQRLELHAHLSWPTWLVPQARAGQAPALAGRPPMIVRTLSSYWGAAHRQPAADPGRAARPGSAPGAAGVRAQTIGARPSPGPRSSWGGSLALRRVGLPATAHIASRFAAPTRQAANALIAAAARVSPGAARRHHRRSLPAESSEAPARSRMFLPVERVVRAARSKGGAPSISHFGRSPLFPQPVPRRHVMEATGRPAPVAVATEAVKAPPPPPPQPSLDVARLAEDVYRHIQRKARIERERRGL